MSVVEHGAVGTQTTSASIARAHRVERYLSLGFALEDADQLADARHSQAVTDRFGTPRVWSTPLHWQRVGRALAAGCPHALALSIFA